MADVKVRDEGGAKSKGLATKLHDALLAVVDGATCANEDECPCCEERTAPANAVFSDGVPDEALARMDWAAGLTDEQVEYLKKGLVLLQHAAEMFCTGAEERAITRLADELEALP